MKITSRIRPANPGFTLIELLTVIAIIAILMGLLFPAVAAVKEAAKKTEAKNACVGIVAAIKNYYTEYGKYPPVTVTGKDGGKPPTTDVIVGDPACTKATTVNNVLFDVLRAIPRGANASPQPNSLNPRKIIFFEGKAVSDATAPRSGFLEKGGEATNLGCYFDPWGKQYNVIIDSNYDNLLDVDQVYDDADWKSDGRPRAGVGAFSMGKDGLVGEIKQKLENKYRDGAKTSDDIVSWQ